MPSGKTVTDHLGNTYKSYKEMCAAYGIDYQTYSGRIGLGWTKEDALTQAPKRRNIAITNTETGHCYESIADAAKQTGVSRKTLTRRLSKGLKENDLFKKAPENGAAIPVKAPDGIEYPSMAAASKAYGISYDTLRNRLKRGIPLDQALTGYKENDSPLKQRNQKNNKTFLEKHYRKLDIHAPIKDHKGNEFKNVNSLCEAYSIQTSTFLNRYRRSGWSMEKTLTTPIKEAPYTKEVADHLGNIYASVSDMCSAYGIDLRVYRNRLNAGHSLEEALTTPVRGNKIVYPLENPETGEKYKSRRDMADKLGISLGALRSRLHHGFEGEDLVQPRMDKGEFRSSKRTTWKPVIDHKGNSFSSISEACRYYGISRMTYNHRINSGCSIKDTLESTRIAKTSDHKGNKFVSQKEMCAFYNINYPTFLYRIKAGWTLEKALTTPIKHKNYL